MNWPEQCAAIIPCHNEAAAIAAVVRGVQRCLPTVLVVDDGSTDDTARVAAAAGAEVLRQTPRRGKGAALTTGWQHARARGFPWSLCLDGDGQHSPDDIPAFLAAATATDARLLIGNRMANPASMPWLRRQVNRWMSRRLSRLAHADLPDTQCGFRLLHLASWSRLTTTAEHFEIESDLLLAFLRARLPVAFVPVQTIYQSEQSKVHPLRDTLRWFRWFWKQ